MDAFRDQAEKVLVIPLHRRRMWLYFVRYCVNYTLLAMAVVALALVGFDKTLFPVSTSSLSSFLNSSRDSLDIAIQIFLVFFFLLMVFVFVYGAWLFWRLLRRLLSQEPVLEIREQGITVCDLLGTQFLTWADIASISARTYQISYRWRPMNYLGIQLTNVDAYILRFHPLVRWFVRGTIGSIGNRISVPDWHMTMSATEIVSEVQRVFRITLSTYHVRTSV